MLADDLARLVDALPSARPTVAVDGPDAAGKTTLADAVAAAARVPVVRASVDGFLRPRAERAALDARGYYRSAFDVPALLAELLEPFASGAPRVRTAVRDHVADVAVDASAAVPPRAVLLVDGVFLLRPELRRLWSLTVHLVVPDEVVLARAAVRDRALLGADVEQRYRLRYLPAQALYRAECGPEGTADVVVDASDWSAPVVLRRP